MPDLEETLAAIQEALKKASERLEQLEKAPKPDDKAIADLTGKIEALQTELATLKKDRPRLARVI